MVSVEAFFADTPAFGAEIAVEVAGFLSQFSNTTTPIVVVTSGGTKVPLERQCVRFIDNSSAGTRGALSAERFLEVRDVCYNVLSRISFCCGSLRCESFQYSILSTLGPAPTCEHPSLPLTESRHAFLLVTALRDRAPHATRCG